MEGMEKGPKMSIWTKSKQVLLIKVLIGNDNFFFLILKYDKHHNWKN